MCVLTPEKAPNSAPGDLLSGACSHLRNPIPDPTLAISAKLGLGGQMDQPLGLGHSASAEDLKLRPLTITKNTVDTATETHS